MQNDAATLQCPNNFCKAANCQTDKSCHLCGTPLIKRYLWAAREEIEAYQLGTLIANRYLLKSNRILLDTKPSLLPETSFSEISHPIKPYLRLVSYRLQVPQVYDLVPLKKGGIRQILLLEQAPIYPDAVLLKGQLMPELTSAWKQATSIRQLNWLWQIAQLWQPFKAEDVASSLLNPQLLRVEGSLMRLLQLQSDQAPPTLSQLGQLWLQLVASARPGIAEFIEQLCHSLIKREIQSAEKLVAVLDQGLAEVGRGREFGSGEPSSILQNTLIIATRTDKGPSRQRNEDACYPPSGTTIETSSHLPVAIVCDGIGGHEGGNIASNLAIASIQQQIQQMPLEDVLDPTTISSELERAARVANDKISQRNDNEQRHGRQRMGTTLVMTLARTHEMYIAHVGDSRAYWITRTGCHQVTLDDNVASREVRLGYALYREALQQPSSGSLVQALGMTSTSLHPTVQRFVIDEDCVFLLCSDGLSDYERVEQCWETEILPILDGKIDVATASQRLVEIGNTQNGHDNVTVGLVYCQVKFSEPSAKLNPSLSTLATFSSLLDSSKASDLEDTNKTLELANADSKLNNTQLLSSQSVVPRRLFVAWLLVNVLLVSVGSVLLTYLLKQDQRPRLTTTGNPTEAQLPESSVAPTIEPQSFSSTPLPSLNKGALIQTKSEIVLSRIELRPEQVITFPRQPVSWIQGSLPVGSVLQVLKKQPTLAQDYWLNLRVCSTPTKQRAGVTNSQSNKNDTTRKTSNIQASATNSRLLQAQDKGWIQETEIKAYYLLVSSLEPAYQVNCPTLTERKVVNKE